MVQQNHLGVIIFCFVAFILVKGHQVEDFRSSTDFLLCRYCGYNVAPASTVINVKSPAAEAIDNHSLFGLEDVGVQTLRNPLGIEFNIVTSKGGTCMGISHHWKTEDSWFPGYAWKPCTCSRCNKLLGWVFEPLASASKERVYASLQGFYALNLEAIISEDYADSLIAKPNII